MLITRNVDLSVGSVLGLSAYLAGDLLSKHPGMALPLVFVLGMALGAACGLFNGVLVTWGQVPALVVTLGTLYAFRGLAFLWTNGTPGQRRDAAGRVPEPRHATRSPACRSS